MRRHHGSLGARPGTSTSAYDVALIFRGAMKYEEFAQTIKLQQAQFPGRNGGTIMLTNDNRLLANYQGAIGGKTGFTDDSQHTYVGAAERNGRRLVVVLLRGQVQPTHITAQAAKLLDYGFVYKRDSWCPQDDVTWFLLEKG